jgi:Homing endonuclease associated repeat
VTKEELMTAIRACAEKLGHAPSIRELQQSCRVSNRNIQKHFGTYKLAIEACGLARRGPGYRVAAEELFHEWARVIRALGKVPTMAEWATTAKFSVEPILKRAGGWGAAAEMFLQYATKKGFENEWGDVVNISTAHLASRKGLGWMSVPGAVPVSKPASTAELGLYGAPLLPVPMTCAPTNEMGVIFLFGAKAVELGYAVTRLQPGFPDGEAWRKVDDDRWQRVRIEFEHESRNFLTHGHSVDGCDLIVCWNHNWPGCPLEVLELKRAFGNQTSIAKIDD